MAAITMKELLGGRLNHRPESSDGWTFPWHIVSSLRTNAASMNTDHNWASNHS